MSLPAVSQGVGKTMLTLVREGDSILRLHFEAGEHPLQVDTQSVQGFSRLEWEGMTFGTGSVGCPDLPTISTLVRLPKGSTLDVKNIDAVSADWMRAVSYGKPVVPVTEGWVKDGPRPKYYPDEKVYGSMDPYRGGERVEVVPLGVMGTEQVYRVTLRPVAYQPAEGYLTIDGVVEVTLTVGGKAVVDSRGREQYLIVSRPLFRDGLQPFVHWKRRQGYEVKELYADTNLRDSIKEMIGNQAPRYMLLVGDVSQIQAYPGTTHPIGMSNHVTDLYYAEFTGDYLPDALLGRWPVNDTAELGAVVRKTLRYEQFVDIDTAQLQRVLLVAGGESQEPAPVTTNGQVNYVAREVRQVHPSLDTLCYHNPASADQRGAILDDLRQGVAWLNFTAHCTTAGWTSPSVTFSSIDTLDNSQPLLYVNNCCLSNAFSGTCFGEQLLRKADGGAIGVIGATNSTLWNEDYYWAVGPKYPFSLTPTFDSERPGAFDRWMGQVGGAQTQGELLVAGNLAVTSFGSPYDKFYWETYCLLGDPSLTPWVEVPQTIELYATNDIRDGNGTLYLGGTAGATVTAMQHDTVLGAGIIGSDGLLALQLCQSIDTTPLVVTATGHGLRPRTDTLTVGVVTGIGVALREVTISDSAVHCCVENVGTMPLYGLRVVMSQMDADSAVDALLTEQQAVVDTLLPHQCSQIVLPVQVEVVGQYPQWQAQLFAWDSTEGILCCLTVGHVMEVVYPTAAFRLLETSGVETHSLLPRHEYILETSIEGHPDAVDLVVTALPTGDTLASPNTPFFTPDTLTHLHWEASLRLGNHTSSYDYWMVGGKRQDSFEEGFASYPWQGGGTHPWQVDSTVRHSGRYSVRSGAIDYRQTSDLILEVLLPQADTLSYWARVSSEAQYDKLLFSVDGVQRGNERWGESDWKLYTTVIAAGRHILRWRYVKDESGSAGSDCAWVDDVRLPLALWDSAYGWFGDIDMLGVDDVGDSPSVLHIYPNPVADRVYIDMLPADSRVLLFDMQGRLLHTSSASNIPVHDYPDGVYLLQVITAVGRYHSKLIIRH